ncbi:MAG TPA: hypothetical protein VME24_02245 [Alphaproteobacteria bacterium]|nr:hypothetical protein [Alphaproteobacteria bacterium]
MREKPEQILKFICIGLGALLFIQFVRIIWTANPLAHVVVPDLPLLADESPATNQIQAPGETTTSSSMNSTKQPGTNEAVVQTNSAMATNVQARIDTASKAAGSGTNATPSQAGTNAMAAPLANAVPANAPNAKTPMHRRHGQFPDAMAMAMGSMPGAKKTTVTPEIQASIDRIIDSEILGPVIRPLPMGLLGIAGNVAFLRGPDGETGLVKEGDTLGDIKLLRIGTNRVLIEQDGQKKELTIFDGIGGETLLDKASQDSNENNKP